MAAPAVAVEAEEDDEDRGGGGSFLDMALVWFGSYLGMCRELQQPGSAGEHGSSLVAKTKQKASTRCAGNTMRCRLA